MVKGSPSEVHAYAHILNDLMSKKGFKRSQIFTQQEFQKEKTLAVQLGNNKPENIVKIGETNYYVIESKNERNKIGSALKEARDDYADKINQSNDVRALFITGIAGNDIEGFTAKSQFFFKNKWETITENGVEITGLLSKLQIERILESKTPHLKDFEISDQEFSKAAEEINGFFHEGGINKDLRAKYISAILLAMSEGTDLNVDTSLHELINSINTRVGLILKKGNKSDFSRFISIELPSSTDNHTAIQKALVKTIQELYFLNIRSAMRSGKDVLGKFYEAFLKYGNGAKEIGIVLTPRHVTKFAVESTNVNSNDLVLDPTCGTGGFLVAAFDEVKKNSSAKNFEIFTRVGLYGIEKQDPVIALAIVNMIFRGDGKTNLIEGDCFVEWLNATTTSKGEPSADYLPTNDKDRIPPITKVLMNPPFPKKKADKKEYFFVEQALKQMQDKGVLFSVLPYSCMTKTGSYLNWRKRLLNENTLLSVITFPEDLFYPVPVRTIGVFIKKGVPHDHKRDVFWARAISDGFVKSKGKRLPDEKTTDDISLIKPELKQFVTEDIKNSKDVPKFKKFSPINFEDVGLELVAENYLDEIAPTLDDVRGGIDSLVRAKIAFLIANRIGGK